MMKKAQRSLPGFFKLAVNETFFKYCNILNTPVSLHHASPAKAFLNSEM